MTYTEKQGLSGNNSTVQTPQAGRNTANRTSPSLIRLLNRDGGTYSERLQKIIIKIETLQALYADDNADTRLGCATALLADELEELMFSGEEADVLDNIVSGKYIVYE